MKHFMLPKSGILRENITTTTEPSSPNPSSLKQRSSPSPRKHKFSKENTDPNGLHDPCSVSPSIAAKPPLSGGKSSRSHHLPPRPPNSIHNPLKRKLNMETNASDSSVSCSLDTGVKVIVRMRPPNKNEEEEEMVVQKVSSDSLSILGQTFTFDSVADTTSTQQEIFQVVGAPLVDNCLAGFNSSIFAYGQTGSGKTYTMWGPANALLERNSQQGLTPRVFEQLFARIQEEQVTHVDKELKYQCRCSFLEIYNEQITDLLDPTQRNLLIREDVKSGVYVENLTEELVCSMDDVTQILVKGFSNRKTGATSINAESSRSHSVFTCVVESRCKSASDGLSSVRISRINLVDLAGSERQKLTGTAGERLKEAGNINRSLSQLGNLINILAEVSQTGKQRHIPYRDSRLTFLLQESLGGNAKLAMICAISPAMSCKSETFSTLRFAQRAKTIKNKAIVNEVTRDDVNVLREVIRQLKEELLRMKENGNQSNSNGGYATSWNARRSLNLLKMSLNRPLTLPHAEEDSDEEMEIDEEDVERVCAEVERVCAQVGSQAPLSDKVVNDSKLGCSQSDSEFVPCDISNNMNNAISSSGDETVLRTMQLNDSSVVLCKNAIVSEKVDVNMEDQPNVVSEEAAVLDSQRRAENYDNQGCLIHTSADLLGASQGQETIQETLMISDCEIMDGKQESESLPGVSETVPVASIPDTSSSSCPNSLPSELSIIPADVSPVLKSPTPSVSPKIISSRKSLRTSTMVSASQKDLITGENCSGEEALRLSFAHPIKRNSLKASSSRTSKNCRTSTEHLAESLHRGLQIIDNHRQSSALGRSSFRFSCKPLDLKSVLPVEKVDVGVQTLSPKHGESDEDPSGYVCGECKNRIIINELKETNENSNMQLVPTEVSPQSADKIKMQVPKAVEKVLAGAIRREMALEEFCNKKTTEISQLNRLIQQYKHERECNAILEQTREDKIIRLESLMDGVLPTEEFMEEELLSLTHEHKILKAKYDNHPEVLRTKIELKRVQDELDAYKNFFDMGERDVLIEEIQHLRSQLKYYTDSSSSISVHRSSLLKLTYSSEPSSAPLSTISESSEPSSEPLSTDSEFTEGSVEDKFEEERQRWTEVESKWISLCEELKIELDASRSLAGKLKQELDSEKKCSEELKEAMQMAMQGHARILEQYAELQESNIALHSRHRKMQEGIEDVKKAAAKAGVKGAESRFINSLAAEISALRAEREKERQYLMDKNKGLQAQLRDTAEAVQAAGELLVRLKEAEEAASIAQERASVAEKEAERAYRQVDSLKRKYEREESRLPKEAARPVYSDYSAVKYDVADSVSHGDEKWREEFEPFHGEDTEISKLSGASSWYSDYDRCNI